jgi:hypothetical protein
MLSECLVICYMCLGVPFIALRQLGAIGDQIGRQFLPSVEWRTGHCPVHTEQFGVPNRLLAQATCRPLISLLTVGSGGSDSPDSPVHHWTVR